MTRRTSFITGLRGVDSHRALPFGLSSFRQLRCHAEKVAKITTLMIDVGLAPVRSANGFSG